MLAWQVLRYQAALSDNDLIAGDLLGAALRALALLVSQKSLGMATAVYANLGTVSLWPQAQGDRSYPDSPAPGGGTNSFHGTVNPTTSPFHVSIVVQTTFSHLAQLNEYWVFWRVAIR